MHAIITCYMLLLYYTVYTSCYGNYTIYWGVFTVGIALIGVIPGGSNAIVSANAIGDYSYVIARVSIGHGVQIARCVTGLGPSDSDDNSAVGGLDFNGNRLPNGRCSDSFSAIVQPQPAGNLNNLGVINIQQCRAFTTTVEGIYTCTMINSSMIEQSVRFGVYFSGRSESFNLYIPSLNHLSSIYIHSWTCDRHSISIYCNSYYWFFLHIILYLTRFSPRHIHMEEG